MNRIVCAVVVLVLAASAHAQPASPPASDAQPAPDTVDEPPRRRRWKLLTAELAGIFAVGQVWYFRNGADGNADDWDMPWGLSSFTAKLTGEAWRFDDNGFVTNSVKHPVIFGAPVHALARLNGFSFIESFAISTGVSYLWEFAGELREYGSLNDMLSTSTGGLPIGETMYQVIKHPRATRFEARGSVAALDQDGYSSVGMRAELDTLTKPGTFVGGKQVRFSLDNLFDGKGTRAWELESRSLLGGRLYESGLLVGAFAAFDYVHKMERPASDYDTFANTVLGATVSHAVQSGDLRVRGTFDLGGDFAMVKPQAFHAWRDMHPDEIVRGALEDNRHRYYYAFGATVEPRVDIAYRGLTAGGRMRAGYFNSIEGRDRWSEQMTMDVKLEDTRTRATAWVGYELHGAALTLEAERDARWGRVDEATSRLVQRRLTASLGYRF